MQSPVLAWPFHSLFLLGAKRFSVVANSIRTKRLDARQLGDQRQWSVFLDAVDLEAALRRANVRRRFNDRRSRNFHPLVRVGFDFLHWNRSKSLLPLFMRYLPHSNSPLPDAKLQQLQANDSAQLPLFVGGCELDIRRPEHDLRRLQPRPPGWPPPDSGLEKHAKTNPFRTSPDGPWGDHC